MARAALRRGLSWQDAAVVAVRPETARTTRIVLEPPSWPGHRPGQHVDVRLTAPDGYTAQRSYSVASAPEAPHLELLVETLPDGEVSPYLTEELRPGDTVEVRGPLGGWFVWTVELGGPLQLIAGGSGVVPFLGMLGHHRAAGSSIPVRLLYSARSSDDLVGRSLLDASGPAVEVSIALTRSAPPDWAGHTGRVDRALLERLVVPPGEAPLVFVCGPTGFVEAIALALVDLGHDPLSVKTERFGASGGTP